MGYVAYEYCDLLELDRADRFSRRALEKCPRDRDASIFAKNLCNRGLVRFFAGHVEEAAATFEAAIAIVSNPESDGDDVREHGRVLAHLGMTTLATPGCDVGLALAQLTQARDLNRMAGDRRRVYVSLGRMGIARYRMDERDAGLGLLAEAAVGHWKMGDARNMIIEVLALSELLARDRGEWPDPRVDAVDPALAELLPWELVGVMANVRPGGPLARYGAVWQAYRRMLGV
jgi:tetratricopeptide (TPR) repeat protein